MFIMSFKVNKKIAKAVIVGVAMLIIAIGLLIAFKDSTDMSLSTMGEHSSEEELAAETIKSLSGKIKTDADLPEYVRLLGWEPAGDPIEIIEVRIPEEFDQVYTAYNDRQKEAGYNLEKYKGKRVKRYAFALNNFENLPPEDVHLHLLVYKDKVIGGDISQTTENGFLYGLKGKA